MSNNDSPRSSLSWLRSQPLYYGSILIILGVIFLLNEYGFHIDMGKLWPLLLIFLGVVVLLGYNRQRRS
jgi:hypothetical protein